MILLTGGAGYIGSHTAVEMINAGFEVVIADNLSNSSPVAVERVGEICGKMPEFVKADVTNRADLHRIFSDYSISAVIHFAGLKSVPDSVAKPLSYYNNNLNATLTLLEVMAQHNCKQIVFSSSATVYSAASRPPFREDAPTACTNPYGWTKLMSEQIITDACKADSELKAVVLRYFNPVGAHESGLIGEDPEGIPLNLFPYICQVAVGRLPRLRVTGHDYDTPDGTGVRDYLHVTDLAIGHLKALEYMPQCSGAEVFNLGSGSGYSVLQMVNAFKDANGIDIPYDLCDRRPGDIAVSVADVRKANEILSWKAERGLDRICRDAWNWQQKNPMGYK